MRGWGVRPGGAHPQDSCSSQHDLLLLAALPRAPAVHGGDRGVHPGGAEDPQTQHGECSRQLQQPGEVLLPHFLRPAAALLPLMAVVSKSAPQSVSAACNWVLLHQCRANKLSVGSSKASKQSHALRMFLLAAYAAPALSHLALGSLFTACMPSLQLKQFENQINNKSRKWGLCSFWAGPSTLFL